jgi:type I restriction-modification system DNA methylase subunit
MAMEDNGKLLPEKNRALRVHQQPKQDRWLSQKAATRHIALSAETGRQVGIYFLQYFLQTGSGQNLRRYLTERATLENIVDFGDVQVFEGVTTYPAILIVGVAFALRLIR